jgi:deoxycytidylate deaminase
MAKRVRSPYAPEGRTTKYVSADNLYMKMAREYAKRHSLDRVMPNAVILVRDHEILGRGANGNNYHQSNECQRIARGIATGEGYELCEGCHPKNHGEQSAIANARSKGRDTRGADLYLWGHWWCCKSCWQLMIEAGIEEVYLLEGSEKLFNKSHPDNVIGKQFDQI